MKILRLIIITLILFVVVEVGQTQSVVMNEIYSRGVAGNRDWVEIYNPLSIAVDITGYKIYDIGGQGGTKPKKPFPTGTVVPANGFYVIITDTADYVGDASGFGLSSTGEWVWLEDAAGTIIDSILFPYMEVNQTYGRYPDGGDWQLLNTITRGTSNVGTSVKNEFELPENYYLKQNYPNPFNPSTVITYYVPAKSFVTLKVYNILGNELVTLVQDEKLKGEYQIEFDASKFPTGLYFYRLSAGGFTQSKKMVLIR